MPATDGRRAAHASVTSPAGSPRHSGVSVQPGARQPHAARRRLREALDGWSRPDVLIPAAALLAAIGFLIARLVPAVGSEPLFEDEAVAGLIGARPLPELLHTVLVDRGGAPLHFVLAHATLGIDSSWVALRWLSVVFAVATVPVAFDLGRRLAGPTAGAVAAIVTATSMMLGVYGSFARMYSLFALVAAIAVDLFVRALERRTTGAAVLAAAAAWLLPATHPYGLILVGAEAVVALVLWRGRPLRAGLAVAAVSLAMVPFIWADLRLTDRFAVGLQGQTSLAEPGDAWSQLARSLAAFAGGSGALFALFLLVGGIGLVALTTRNRPFAAFALLAIVVSPLLFIVLGTAQSSGLHGLSPRHLVFLLPIWAALVGVGVARLLERRSLAVVAAGLAVVGIAAALAPPGGIRDPREMESNVALGGGAPSVAPGAPDAIAAPAAWLRRTLRDGDVVYPISPVFFAALPEAADVHALPRAQQNLLLSALDRATLPARDLLIAVPVGSANLDLWKMRARLGTGFTLHPYSRWLLVEAHGPFPDRASMLQSTFWAYRAAKRALHGPVPSQVPAYLKYGYSVVCDSLRSLHGRCTERP
jgi:hypothetical protein